MNTKKYILISVATFFLLQTTLAQVTYDERASGHLPPSPTEIYFGSAAFSLRKTLDNNMIGLVGNGYPVFGLMKFDLAGNPIWVKNFIDSLMYYNNNPPPHHYIGARKVVQLSDSSYIIIANFQLEDYNMVNEKPFLIKTDKNGNFLWANYYSRDNSPLSIVNTTFVHDVMPTADMGFLIIGGYNTGMYNQVIKCNANGNVQWINSFSGMSSLFPGGDALPTSDGGYIMYGDFSAGSTPSLMKIDSTGYPVFIRRYNAPACGNCSGNYRIAETPNGYMLTGTRTNATGGKDPFLISTDSVGNMLWFKMYSVTTTQDATVGCIARTVNNEYIVMGQLPDTSGNGPQLLYFKTDSIGNVKLMRQKTSGGNVHYAFSLLPIGNGFMFGGYYYSSGAMAMLNSIPQGICGFVNLNADVTPYTYVQSNPLPTAVISNPQLYVIPLPYAFDFDSSFWDSTLCPSVSAIEEHLNENTISLFPNPTNGIFTITTGQSVIKNIEVINVLGEKVQGLNVFTHTGTIDLSSNPDGIYFVRVNTEKGTVSKKIIISR